MTMTETQPPKRGRGPQRPFDVRAAELLDREILRILRDGYRKLDADGNPVTVDPPGAVLREARQRISEARKARLEDEKRGPAGLLGEAMRRGAVYKRPCPLDVNGNYRPPGEGPD